MTTPDPKLSSLTAPPQGRADSLRGLMPRAAPPQRAAEPEPGPVRTEPKPKQPPRPKQKRPEVKPDGDASPYRIVPARIPGSLFERVNVERAKTNSTHEMFFLSCFEQVYDRLAEHYKPADSGKTRVPQRRRRGRRLPGEPLTQYPLKLTTEEADALYGLADELHPTSIAEFVTTIVALALGEDSGQSER